MDDLIVYAPAGDKAGQSIPVNMSYWGQLEARIQEIESVTPVKAPELLAVFTMAALELDRLHNTLELEHQRAIREVDRVKGEVILDRIPTILKARGLATDRNPLGSEDLRSAVLSQDQEYADAVERVDLLKSMSRMVKGKHDAFERAFRAVKTLVGEQNFNYSGNYSGKNRNLTGGTGSSEPGQESVSFPGFGTPKYNSR